MPSKMWNYAVNASGLIYLPWPTPVVPWLAKPAADAPEWELLFCGESEGRREVRNTPGAMAPLPLGPPGPKGPGPAVYSWSNRLAEK